MSTAPQQPTYIIPPPSSPNWKTPLLIGILVLLAATNIYLLVQIDRLRTDSRTDMARLRDEFSASVDKLRIDSSEQVQRSRRSLDTLQNQLAEQRQEAARAVGQAKVDAQKKVDALQAKVTAGEAQQQQAIESVKQSSDAATTKLNSDIGTVKTDVQATKSQLEETIANLKRATGELDSHASLIATNASELKALKELGERNYSEFTIHKTKDPTRVGNVMVLLKKTDTKHNRFTLNITVDDKTVEKKDRTINEPIQFYTSQARQPDEIVVNSVTKDTIVGYLASPKVQASRTGS
jgi:DNA repair exonuclease SbcCD ATPase subunit